jgi:hypothetical protein
MADVADQNQEFIILLIHHHTFLHKKKQGAQRYFLFDIITTTIVEQQNILHREKLSHYSTLNTNPLRTSIVARYIQLT